MRKVFLTSMILGLTLLPNSFADYKWELTSNPNELVLKYNTKTVGLYSKETSQYYPYINNNYQTPVLPPIDPPITLNSMSLINNGEQREPSGILNYGLDLDELNRSNKKITINGKPVSKKEVISYLKDNKVIPNDINNLKLTIIAKDLNIATSIKNEIVQNPAFKNYSIQAYANNDVLVQKTHLTGPQAPDVEIVIQDKDGVVLHRQGDYNDGIDGLLKIISKQEIKEFDPNYDPAKDPDLRKPKPVINTSFDLNTLIEKLKNVNPIIYLLGIVGLLFYFKKDTQNN